MHQRIIAVDFDGTLAVNRYPNIGEPICDVVDMIKAAQANGAKVILWTCRYDADLQNALDWCHALGLFFDAVNENLPEMIEFFGNDTRKIFATEYWDDRAVQIPSKSKE